MRHFFKMLFDDRYRERNFCAQRIRQCRAKRDAARLLPDPIEAGFWEFAAQVERNSRPCFFTSTR